MSTLPVSRSVFVPERLDLFWWFVYERQSVWHRRNVAKTPPPWTGNEILKTFRFTNVYRELDPGTIYAIHKILETETPRADKIFNIMIYRLLGRWETHEAIGFQHLGSFDPRRLATVLKDIRDSQRKSPFTGAYMVSAYTQMGSKDKVDNVVRLFNLLRERFSDICGRIQRCRSSAEVYDILRSPYGFGNFLAYQVLVDLLYPLKAYCGLPLLPYSHDDWASAGPGAIRGIKMLVKQGVAVRPLDVMRWLRESQVSEFERLGTQFPYLVDDRGRNKPISLANIQNCLCEYHKYVKILEGTGKARRRFDLVNPVGVPFRELVQDPLRFRSGQPISL